MKRLLSSALKILFMISVKDDLYTVLLVSTDTAIEDWTNWSNAVFSSPILTFMLTQDRFVRPILWSVKAQLGSESPIPAVTWK